MAFDAFYYSWSTPVAKWIEVNSWSRGVIKPLLYPLIGVLKLTVLLSEPFIGLNAEAGAVFAGFLASSLLGLVYLAPILIVYNIFTRRTSTKRPLKCLAYASLGSLVLIGVAELMAWQPLLILSTSAFVLANILLAPMTIAYIVKRR